jgi:hypothetical protein
VTGETTLAEAGKDQLLQWLINKLRKSGFDIRRNFIVEIGGISHTVDVLAVLNPLAGVEVRLAFIVSNSDIGPGDVEKYFTWKYEGGFDKVVIITNGRVSVEAFELAKKFGVDIVRAGRDVEVRYADLVGSYSVLHVHPLIDRNEALSIFERLSRGFLKKKKELISMLLIYFPFIEFDMEVRLFGEEAEEIRRLKMTFDGVRGAIVTEEGGTPTLKKERGSYAEFSDPALDVLRIIVRDGYKTVNEIAMELKLGEGKIRSIANYLLTKELADVYQDIIELRKSLFDNAFSIVDFLKEKKVEIHENEPESTHEHLVIFPRINMERLIEFLEIFSRSINSLNVVYYPFYIGFMRENTGTLKITIIDALNGEENPSLIWALSEVEDIIERKALVKE